MSGQKLLLPQEFRISYYHLSPEDHEKIQLFCEASGDKEPALLNQYIRGFLGRHREKYFLKLAKLDAESRRLKSAEWVNIILAHGMKGMPPRRSEIKLEDLPRNPLEHIIAPSGDDKILRYPNYITLAAQNIAFLRLGIFYDGGTIAAYVSRIVREHIARNWDALYVRQINAARNEVWF